MWKEQPPLQAPESHWFGGEDSHVSFTPGANKTLEKTPCIVLCSLEASEQAIRTNDCFLMKFWFLEKQTAALETVYTNDQSVNVKKKKKKCQCLLPMPHNHWDRIQNILYSNKRQQKLCLLISKYTFSILFYSFKFFLDLLKYNWQAKIVYISGIHLNVLINK